VARLGKERGGARLFLHRFLFGTMRRRWGNVYVVDLRYRESRASSVRRVLVAVQGDVQVFGGFGVSRFRSFQIQPRLAHGDEILTTTVGKHFKLAEIVRSDPCTNLANFSSLDRVCSKRCPPPHLAVLQIRHHPGPRFASIYF
jgi:hypothetical protein